MILDTDVLIDFQRSRPGAKAWLRSLSGSPMICGISALELIQDSRNTFHVSMALRLLRPFQVVWPTAADGERALELFGYLHLSHGIDLTDTLIASCAMGLGVPLATCNVKHFRAIPGLEILVPYAK